LKIVYQSAKSRTKIAQNPNVIQINFHAMPHDEQKYIQRFGGETRRKKTTWKNKVQIEGYQIRSQRKKNGGVGLDLCGSGKSRAADSS
jgi:hypothetical protein